MDVDLPKLRGHKLPLGPLLLEGDILYDNDVDDDDDNDDDDNDNQTLMSC